MVCRWFKSKGVPQAKQRSKQESYGESKYSSGWPYPWKCNAPAFERKRDLTVAAWRNELHDSRHASQWAFWCLSKVIIILHNWFTVVFVIERWENVRHERHAVSLVENGLPLSWCPPSFH